MDSGHPPTFGIYLAMVWNLFGKSLPVSHFAMIPFLFGIIIYLHQLGKYFFSTNWVILGFVFLNLLDPCLAGQAVLVSPDLVLVFFFLMTAYGIFSQKKINIIFGIIGLCIISTRGMMTAFAFFLFDYLNHFWMEKKSFNFKTFISKGLPYLPGALLGFTFLVAHYFHTGWIGYHESSPWAPAFEKVSTDGFLNNLLILGWRFLDLGRFFLFAFIFIVGFYFLKKRTLLNQKTKQLLLLFTCLFLFLVPPLVLHKMLLGHRYLLPLFLIINLLAFYLISIFEGKKLTKNIFFIIAITGLTLGNFWIYPKKIAQSWDSTLAILPYFDLRKDMIQYIETANIPFDKIGSVFPNIQTFKLIDLNESTNRFVEKDLEKNKFIFYSNVFNDFSDEEIDALENDWKIEKSFERNRIYIILYKKKGTEF